MLIFKEAIVVCVPICCRSHFMWTGHIVSFRSGWVHMLGNFIFRVWGGKIHLLRVGLVDGLMDVLLSFLFYGQDWTIKFKRMIVDELLGVGCSNFDYGFRDGVMCWLAVRAWDWPCGCVWFTCCGEYVVISLVWLVIVCFQVVVVQGVRGVIVA